MFGTLLESRAAKQRRRGGATLSVGAHVAIITAVVAGTVQGKTRPHESIEPIDVVYRVNTAVAPVPRSRANVVADRPSLPVNVMIRHVEIPTFTPTTLPAIVPSAAPPADRIVLGEPTITGGIGGGMASVFFADERSSRDWAIHETLMNVVVKATPAYPEALRRANVEGRVLVQFAVDTLGRVDMASVKILQSTHDLFAAAVKDALKDFRFRPAVVEGHKVAALAQMPFDFQLTK